MEKTPTRRRRAADVADATAPDQAPETGATPPRRRRRASVGGHAMKLQAPTRAGYVRRWVNDADNRIAEMEELAYDFVEDPSIKSTGEGSRVSRLVGTKANGEPLRAYLMETPEEEFRAGLDEKEAHLRQIDDAMTRIADESGQTVPQSGQYGQVSIHRER